MRTFKLLVLAGLAVLALNVKAQADSIQYHWVTQNEVVLWASPNDINPVTATLDPNGNIWSYGPPEVAARWKPILEKVVSQYSPPPLKDGAELWKFVLTKLRNEYDKVSWAQKREPSVEVYLVQKGVGARGVESLSLFIVSRIAAPVRKEIPFTRPTRGKWSKGGNKIDLKTLFGVGESSEEIRKIFDIPRDKPLPRGLAGWEAFWDEWINKNLNSSPRYTEVTYVDDVGKPHWLWVELLAAGANPPAGSRLMPSAPVDIPETTQVIVPPPASSWWELGNIDWVWWLPVILLVLTAVTVLVFFPVARGVVFNLFLLPWRAVARLRSPPEHAEAGRGVTVDNLNKLHAHVQASYRRAAGKNGEPPVALINALDWLHTEYVTAATDERLLRETTTQQRELFNSLILEKLGVEADEARLKRWVDLGRKFEDAAPAMSGLAIHADVQKLLDDGQKKGQGPLDDWAAKWPQTIKAYHLSLQQSDENNRVLHSKNGQMERDYAAEISKMKREHTAALSKQAADLKTSSEERYNEMDRKKKTAEKELIKVRSELEASTLKVTQLNGKVEALEGHLATARTEKKKASEDTVVLQRKAERIEEVQRLSRKLRSWLQGYYGARVKENDDLRPVALLASLINFSLCQLCFSIMDDREKLCEVMAHNLLRLAERFEQSSGDEFGEARSLLASIAPDGAGVLKDLKESNFTEGRLDDPLFRGFLSSLKADTGKNLSPFFIDIDKQENKLVRVNIS